MTLTQPDGAGHGRHLLTLDGMSRDALVHLLDRAQHFSEHAHDGGVRKVLAGKAICTLFFEPSTRTRSSFHLAATRLGADTLNFDASTSSTTKGETAIDTLKTIEAMGVDGFVIRHPTDGAIAELVAAANAGTAVVNAGDGRTAHPTQGLLDMLTLRQAKGDDFAGLKVLIVGDVRHSRVARSDLHALRALGTHDIRICGPQSLLPSDDTLRGCRVVDDFDAALEGIDVIMMLRLQRERMQEGLIDSLENYHREYGLTVARLRRASTDAVVLHPGPMNRGVEIDDAVADGPQSLILQQVANGVAVRMAVLEELMR